MTGQLKFASVANEQNKEAAAALGITKVPTLVHYKKGKVVTQYTGHQEQQIDKVLAGGRQANIKMMSQGIHFQDKNKYSLRYVKLLGILLAAFSLLIFAIVLWPRQTDNKQISLGQTFDQGNNQFQFAALDDPCTVSPLCPFYNELGSVPS